MMTILPRFQDSHNIRHLLYRQSVLHQYWISTSSFIALFRPFQHCRLEKQTRERDVCRSLLIRWSQIRFPCFPPRCCGDRRAISRNLDPNFMRLICDLSLLSPPLSRPSRAANRSIAKEGKLTCEIEMSRFLNNYQESWIAIISACLWHEKFWIGRKFLLQFLFNPNSGSNSR